MSSQPTIKYEPFGVAPNGEEIQLYTLEIPGIIKASVMNYGATLTHLYVPDRHGKMEDIVLGFDDFEGYLSEDYQENYCYLGSTIGRIGGRIKGNQFDLEGISYKLEPNQGSTHLHGGKHGWDRKVWKAKLIENEKILGIEFSLISPEGEENYPGNIKMQVIYMISFDGDLTLEYHGKTDKTTILNPTNHSYFNLSGDFSKDILNHQLQIAAKHFLPVDDKSFPTGELKSVGNTPFDFLEEKEIGKSLEQNDRQLKYGNGIDHSFALDIHEDCLSLYEPKSGRALKLSTTEPGVQIYTSNYLDGSIKGKNETSYKKNAAICLETQHFPDSINQKAFPSVVLRPEEDFFSKTTFKFSTR
ncbi:galactose mutarotase-like enzyme [Belliella baltica DSM 15883]|uniref:Aldose 1-epimerase n=1 Tax=Belliella baltica (strain DSM 15883 / CIP 108006 / LMG 21964 / BA134) TaxID=866536 RepID=I3Z167_BELBD|nr:aldose epimerase family protein [Belliella baltica]AFL82985.1 galactose mutarotase-like enzyme [Belliella baltica DSM 15883]